LLAIPYFEQAIQKDSLYARAYAGLSDSYSYLAGFGGGLPPSALSNKAEAAALRAVALDPDLPEALTSVALFHMIFDWHWPAVGDAMGKAIRASPRSAQLRLYNAFYLLAIGKTADALEETKRAEELEPFFQIAPVRVGQFYYFSHQYDFAIRQLKRALTFDSTYRIAQASIALAYSQVGQHDSAIAWARKAGLGHERAYGPLGAVLGVAYAMAGRRSEALAVIRNLQEEGRRFYIPPISIATIYASLDERDSAFVWLDRSYKDGYWSFSYVRAEPLFDRLHADPRWDSLIRQMKFP